MESHTPPARTDVDATSRVEGAEGEERQERRPVLEKVKQKVKKIKDTIGKKTHGFANRQNGSAEEDDDDEEGEVDEEGVEEEPEVHGAPIYERTKETGTPDREFVEDPAAPRSGTGVVTTAEQRRDDEELEVNPDLLEAMRISDEPRGGVSIQDNPDDQKLGHTEKTSSFKETAASTISTVHEKAAEVGTMVMEKVRSITKAVGENDEKRSVKDYIAEKLTPGEGEKALSQMITETMQKRREVNDFGET